MTALDSPGFYAHADGYAFYISPCSCEWKLTGQLDNPCEGHAPFCGTAQSANDVLFRMRLWVKAQAEEREMAA